jgi:hypothetical protein
MSFETLISGSLSQAFGGDLILGVIIFMVMNIFMVVSRVPSAVILISNGFLLLMLGLPSDLDIGGTKYVTGGLGLGGFGWVWAVVVLVTTGILFLTWRKFTKRDF